MPIVDIQKSSVMTKGLPTEAASCMDQTVPLTYLDLFCLPAAGSNGIAPLVAKKCPNGVEMSPPLRASTGEISDGNKPKDEIKDGRT